VVLGHEGFESLNVPMVDPVEETQSDRVGRAAEVIHGLMVALEPKSVD